MNKISLDAHNRFRGHCRSSGMGFPLSSMFENIFLCLVVFILVREIYWKEIMIGNESLVVIGSNKSIPRSSCGFSED